MEKSTELFGVSQDGRTPSSSVSPGLEAQTARASENAGPPIAQPIQVVSAPQMPMPGNPGAPYFKGDDVTRYLRLFERLCKANRLPEEEKTEWFADYCSPSVSSWISTQPEYEEKNYPKLAEATKREYAHRDKHQRKYNVQWLERFKNVKRDGSEDLREYNREYQAVSEALVTSGELSRYLQGVWYLQGLPEELKQQVVRELNVDYRTPSTIKYANFRKEVVDRVRTIETLRYLDSGEPEKDQDVAASTKEKVTEEDDTRLLIKPDGTYPDENKSGTKQQSAEVKSTEQSQIDQLTKEFEKLKLYGMQYMGRPNGGMPNAGINMQARAPSGFNPTGGSGIPPNSCNFCWAPDHIRSYCPDLKSLLNQKLVHWGEDRKLHFGPEGQNGEVIRLIWGNMSQKEIVEQRLKEEQRNVSSIGYDIQSIMLGQPGDDSSSEEEAGDIVENYYSVNAMGSDKPQGVKKRQSGTERLHKEKLQKAIEREQRFPSVKTNRFGNYQPPSTTEKVRMVEEEMKDAPKQSEDEKVAETKEKQKSKRFKVADELKGTTDVMGVMNQILDTGVQMSIRDLIGLSPNLHKALFTSQPQQVTTKAIFHDTKGVRFDASVSNTEYMVNSADQCTCASSQLEPLDEDKVLYAAATLKLPIRINGYEEARNVMVDSGAEINVMHRDVANHYKLIVSQKFGGNMISADGGQTPFVGLCEEVPVQVGSFHYKVPFFVVNNKINHDCVLGRPFEHQARLRHVALSDGTVESTIYSMDRKNRAVVRVFSIDDPRNKSREEVLRDLSSRAQESLN
ncbi:hypothetical protein DTO195F2_9269 [Paecilomyces variotii]|nr:hypothetical protein DTO195F2_9269 [Paecilomyces variotii]